MGFVDAVMTCLSKFVTFSGRASRSEFWWFRLFFFLSIVVGFLFTAGVNSALGIQRGSTGASVTGAMFGLAFLCLVLADLAVLVRRLHDTDRSGWAFFVALIPFIGGILLLVWCCTRGTQGGNRYGDDPLLDGYAHTFA